MYLCIHNNVYRYVTRIHVNYMHGLTWIFEPNFILKIFFYIYCNWNASRSVISENSTVFVNKQTNTVQYWNEVFFSKQDIFNAFTFSILRDIYIYLLAYCCFSLKNKLKQFHWYFYQLNVSWNVAFLKCTKNNGVCFQGKHIWVCLSVETWFFCCFSDLKIFVIYKT